MKYCHACVNMQTLVLYCIICNGSLGMDRLEMPKKINILSTIVCFMWCPVIVCRMQVLLNYKKGIMWHHTGVERNALEFVVGPLQFCTRFVVVTHPNYSCKKCMQAIHAQFQGIWYVWFVSYLGFLLHIAVGLLYSNWWNALKIQQKIIKKL